MNTMRFEDQGTTLFETASGRLVDLMNPRVEDIDFGDIAEHLAKENRFNGGTPGVSYSVAEHLCRGADAIFEETGDPTMAGCFLIHDAPEAYLKDDVRPKKKTVALIAQQQFGVLSGSIMSAFDQMTVNFDRVIAAAAGLPYPWPAVVASMVEYFDEVMLVTEWRDLKKTPLPMGLTRKVTPLPDEIVPWHWSAARTHLETRFNKWLPACADRFWTGVSG